MLLGKSHEHLRNDVVCVRHCDHYDRYVYEAHPRRHASSSIVLDLRNQTNATKLIMDSQRQAPLKNPTIIKKRIVHARTSFTF